MKLAATILLGIVLFASSWAVRAQETIDIAKITCDQYMDYKFTDPHNIAMLLLGYYKAKRGSTVVEVGEFQASVRKLEDYCIRHNNTPVFQAFQEVFKVAK
jgi:hypothetical protein